MYKRILVTTTYDFADKWTQLHKKACEAHVRICSELTIAVMMRKQQIHKNHIYIYILLILKVVTLSFKDAELWSRQITWKLRQWAMSNTIVTHELNET